MIECRMTFTVSLHSFDPAKRNVKLMGLDGVFAEVAGCVWVKVPGRSFTLSSG
jgi:hypothetical protein